MGMGRVQWQAYTYVSLCRTLLQGHVYIYFLGRMGNGVCSIWRTAGILFYCLGPSRSSDSKDLSRVVTSCLLQRLTLLSMVFPYLDFRSRQYLVTCSRCIAPLFSLLLFSFLATNVYVRSITFASAIIDVFVSETIIIRL